MRWSVRYDQKKGHRRDAEQSFFHPQILEGQSHHTPWGIICKGNRFSPTGGEPRVRRVGQIPLLGSGKAPKARGSFLVHVNVTRSPGKAKGELAAGATPLPRSTWVTWEEYSVCVWGPWGSQKIRSFTNYYTMDFEGPQYQRCSLGWIAIVIWVWRCWRWQGQCDLVPEAKLW